MTSVLTLLIIILAGTTAIGITNNSTYAQQGGQFTATLSGGNEVPPTESSATGNAEFTTLEENGTGVVVFSINASNTTGFTAGHIHIGKQGVNGPVVATLFNYGSPSNEVAVTGYITADKLEGPMSGKPIFDLINAITNGETYANIHTERNPNGDIRGQIT